jgi:hypothetical protein
METPSTPLHQPMRSQMKMFRRPQPVQWTVRTSIRLCDRSRLGRHHPQSQKRRRRQPRSTFQQPLSERHRSSPRPAASLSIARDIPVPPKSGQATGTNNKPVSADQLRRWERSGAVTNDVRRGLKCSSKQSMWSNKRTHGRCLYARNDVDTARRRVRYANKVREHNDAAPVAPRASIQPVDRRLDNSTAFSVCSAWRTAAHRQDAWRPRARWRRTRTQHRT